MATPHPFTCSSGGELEIVDRRVKSNGRGREMSYHSVQALEDRAPVVVGAVLPRRLQTTLLLEVREESIRLGLVAHHESRRAFEAGQGSGRGNLELPGG